MFFQVIFFLLWSLRFRFFVCVGEIETEFGEKPKNREERGREYTIQARNFARTNKRKKLHKNALKLIIAIRILLLVLVLLSLTFQSHCNAVHGLQSILTLRIQACVY